MYESLSTLRSIFNNANHSQWEGACLDTGTQKTVIGYSNRKRTVSSQNKNLKNTTSNSTYRFGNDYQQSVRSLNICISLSENIFKAEMVDVLHAEIPFVIGLDTMDKYKMTVDNVQNTICFHKLQLETPLVRKKGLIYLE